MAVDAGINETIIHYSNCIDDILRLESNIAIIIFVGTIPFFTKDCHHFVNGNLHGFLVFEKKELHMGIEICAAKMMDCCEMIFREDKIIVYILFFDTREIIYHCTKVFFVFLQ